MALHTAISVACSILIFPESINARYGKCLQEVLVPLRDTFEKQPSLLCQQITDIHAFVDPLSQSLAQAEMALGPLSAARRLMKRDVSWGRFGPNDLIRFHHIARTLTVNYSLL